MSADQAKKYSPQEEFWNTATHVCGILFALTAGAYLVFRTLQNADTVNTAAVIFYSFSLVLMFGCSALYHGVCNAGCKTFLRKADHCAIYFLISGTYAPLLAGTMRTLTGLIIMIFLISLSIAGTVGNLVCPGKFRKFEICIFLVMGWCCICVIKDLYLNMGTAAFILLLAGGVTYCAGVIFYKLRKPYAHTVWHLFVLGGALLQYLAIAALPNL